MYRLIHRFCGHFSPCYLFVFNGPLPRIAHIPNISCYILLRLNCHQIDDLNSVKRICLRAALFLLAVHVRLCLDLQFSQERLQYGSDGINLHIIKCQCWWSKGLIQWGCGNAGTRISKWVKSRHFEWKNNAESRIVFVGGSGQAMLGTATKQSN